MEGFIKEELPEPTEYDIYVDIDGVPEEEKARFSNSKPASQVNDRESAVQKRLQMVRSTPGTEHISTKETEMIRSIFLETSTSTNSKKSDSDDAEVDVDTPFDGKLFGQTHSTVKRRSNVLLELLSHARETNSTSKSHVAKKSSTPERKFGVAKKSTPLKKLDAAIKSTTLRSVPVKLKRDVAVKSTMPKKSNVAMKSTVSQKPNVAMKTALPLKRNVAMKSTMPQNPNVAKTSTIPQKLNVAMKSTMPQKPNVALKSTMPRKLNVAMKSTSKVGMFYPEKSSFASMLSRLTDRDTSNQNSQSLQYLSSQKRSDKFRRDLVNSHTPQTASNKIFMCNKHSHKKMACPECSEVVRQFSLKAHLKTIHNLTMRICKRCRICFTDLDLYSEHYALHLQQEEDYNSGVHSAPIKLNIGSNTRQTEFPIQDERPSKRHKSSLLQSHEDLNKRSLNSRCSNEMRFPVEQELLPKSRMLPFPKSMLSSQKSARERPSFHQFPNESLHQLSEMAYPERPEHENLFQSSKRTSFLDSVRSPSEVSNSMTRRIGGNFYFSWPRETSFSDYSDMQTPPSKKRLTSMVEARQNIAVSRFPSERPHFSSDMTFSAQSGQASDRRHSLTAMDRSFHSSGSMSSSEGHRERSSAASFQSEDSSSSDFSESGWSASDYYSRNLKTAIRRGQYSDPVECELPAKYIFLDGYSAPVLCRGNYDEREEARITLVSLENASKPYDCRTCLAAFQLALSCPGSFRQHSKVKTYACNCRTTSKYFTQQKTSLKAPASPLSDEQEETCIDYPNVVTCQTESSSNKQSIGEFKTISVNRQDGLYECHICLQRFKFQSNLLRHLPYHTDQYSCGFCKKNYKEKVDLLEHFQILHRGREQIRCKYCFRKFEDFSEFEYHIRTHKNGTVVDCTECGKNFSDSSQLLLHLKQDHDSSQPENKHGCKVCSKRFSTAKNLSLHIKYTHSQAKPIITKFLPCKLCNKLFHKKQGLSSHYRLCHETSLADALFMTSAETCAQINPDTKEELVSFAQFKHSIPALHGKTKVNVAADKRFKCPICCSRLNSLRGLKVHYKLRHNMPLPKTETTLSSESATNSLQAHKQTKLVSKAATKSKGSHKCFRCGKCFSSRSNLGRHTNVFHGQTKHRTVEVTKGLFHSEQHWICPFCGKQFTGRKRMRRHVKNSHPEKFEDERHLKRCPKSGQFLRKGDNLISHVKSCDSKQANTKETPVNNDIKKYRCSLCEKAFIWKGSLKRHLQIHHELPKQDHPKETPEKKESYSCTLCEKTFNYKQSFLQHLQKQHKIPQKDTIFNMNSFSENVTAQSVQKNDPLYLCDLCKKCFTSKKSLKKHQARVHGRRTGIFECRIRVCKKRYTHNDSLMYHYRTCHPGVSPFYCTRCSSGFESSRDILEHKCNTVVKSLSVGSIQPKEIKEKDASTAAPPSQQECHYRCTTCGKGFHIAREWTKHMQTHSYSVSKAAADYESVMDATDNMKLNIFDILSSSVFTCPCCEKIFTDENAFTVHNCETLPNPKLSSEKQSTMTTKCNINKQFITDDPIRCTFCLKFFPVLTIEHHVMDIHNKSVKVCMKCNIIFTDVKHFQSHCQVHEEQEMGTNSLVPASDFSDASATFFLCHSCGAHFTDSNSFKLHKCAGTKSGHLTSALSDVQLAAPLVASILSGITIKQEVNQDINEWRHTGNTVSKSRESLQSQMSEGNADPETTNVTVTGELETSVTSNGQDINEGHHTVNTVSRSKEVLQSQQSERNAVTETTNVTVTDELETSVASNDQDINEGHHTGNTVSRSKEVLQSQQSERNAVPETTNVTVTGELETSVASNSPDNSENRNSVSDSLVNSFTVSVDRNQNENVHHNFDSNRSMPEIQIETAHAIGLNENHDSVSKGSSLDPVSKGCLLNPVSKGCSVDPVSKGCLLNPVSKGCSVDPVSKGCLLNPVSKGCSVDPVSKGCSVDPVGCSVDPVGCSVDPNVVIPAENLNEIHKDSNCGQLTSVGELSVGELVSQNIPEEDINKKFSRGGNNCQEMREMGEECELEAQPCDSPPQLEDLLDRKSCMAQNGRTGETEVKSVSISGIQVFHEDAEKNTDEIR